MVEKDDWRLSSMWNLERFKNVTLYKKQYHPPRADWDHDHCEFCWDKFSEYEGDLHEGYCANNSNWICEQCYQDFKEMFNFALGNNEEPLQKGHKKACKAMVFDMGGTLMEYEGMPQSWVDFYKTGFERAARACGIVLNEADLEQSVEIMKSLNPRICKREVEYAPQFIFEKATAHWNGNKDFDQIIESFFSGLDLKPMIYSDTVSTMDALHKNGFFVAILTDLPSGMPDELFQKHMKSVVERADVYTSSLTCGWRKPNAKGLRVIAEQLHVKLSDLVYVGDEEKDRFTAINGGCKFIRMDRKNEGLAAALKEYL